MSQVALGLAYSLNNAVALLMPCVFRSFERGFGVGPPELGVLTLCMWLMASATSPFWGFCADSFLPSRTLAGGMAVTALGLLGLALSSTFGQVVLFTSVVGGGLSSVTPVVQAVVSLTFPEKERGRAFGLLGLCGALAALVSSTIALSVSNATVYGFAGWRVLFVHVALLCLTSSFTSLSLIVSPSPLPSPLPSSRPPRTPAFGFDPRHPAPSHSPRHRHHHEEGVVEGEEEEEEQALLSVPSQPSPRPPRTLGSILLSWVQHLRLLRSVTTLWLFLINWSLSSLVFFGSFEFVLLWFQYMGFSDGETAVLFACFQLGAGVGQLVGGHAGDWLAVRRPNSGRLRLASTSYLLSLAVFVVLFEGVERSPDQGVAFSALLLLLGLVTNLSLAGCDLPILAEVVHADMRASAVASLQALTGVVGAFGASIVGLLAQHGFGYEANSSDIDTMPPNTRHSNMVALGKAVAVGLVVPWTGNVVCYTLSLRSYPHDRDQVTRRTPTRGGALPRTPE